MAPNTRTSTPPPVRRRSPLLLLGPAFVAAIAYVDPGNVAANITAGARYGFLLVWVLVLASAMSVLIQYQSAKLGLVTDKSLPALLGDRLPRPARLAYWAQAELVSAATDLAEVIGGALALYLLFGLPLPIGGLIVGVVSMIMLGLQARRRQRSFEFVIMGLLAVITIGFLTGLVINPPAAGDVLGGLTPRFAGTDSVLVAASMLGATVMPHAIYLHSSLVLDRHGTGHDPSVRRRLLKATRLDVLLALAVAGLVNIALLLLAAESLRGQPGTDSIEGAHAAIATAFGPGVALVFAIGLLASGLASTSVGAYAGSEIMAGLIHRRIPLVLRRLVTLLPALVLLSVGIEPTWALVLSQVVLSFGIPFALVPLVALTGSSRVMGELRNGPALRVVSVLVIAAIIALNLALLFLTLTGL
ncbi:Nramp family divalent metal transporter [Propionibacteriaceae bacterium Y2011]|uniref:Nramp family divalent metal transporter n=1 Tax=Microlunatus sp. Y2014 TaxID=3418488 RepID=UPI003B4B5A58